MAKYTIGLDYGTLSVRALLLNIETGKESGSFVYDYPHGVMETHLPNGRRLPAGWALQDADDYFEGLKTVVRGLVTKYDLLPEEVVGIGVDFTSSTVIPVKKDGTPLSAQDKFKNEPHAYVKLWKHHGAEKEARYIDEVIQAQHIDWISLYGGKVSSEWMIPKILETLRYAPDVYETADYFIEALDWITWVLTGKQTRSACGAGYKAFYHHDHYPDPSFFEALDPRLENLAAEKLAAPILPVGSKAGYLSEKMASQLHLQAGIPVATGIIDAHASMIGSGISQPGEMMIIVGTSSCHMLLSDTEAGIPGVGGLVKDGIIPGYYAYEAGQACVGDHFDWFVRNGVPAIYKNEAESQEISIHTYLCNKLKDYQPGRSGLLGLDWWNGVRSPLMDFNLNGLMLGLNLLTKPEEIYMALLEATAYGTRLIIEGFEKAGIKVDRLVLGGGIPAKNKLLVQLYANVTGRSIRCSSSPQASGLGAAILAAYATDHYQNIHECVAALGKIEEKEYVPDGNAKKVYDQLYQDYKRLGRYFSHENDVMKRLNALREENK